MRRTLVITFLLSFVALSALAAEFPLTDEAQEERAEKLFRQIHCNICGTESLADSPADVASAMRQAIRVHIAAGDTTKDIVDDLTATYGNVFVLRHTTFLEASLYWIGPAMMVIIAVFFMWSGVKRVFYREHIK